MPCRRCAGATTKQTIAAASCAGTGSVGRGYAHARAGEAQLVVRLRVHPADDVVAVVGEEAFHLARLDARRHRAPVHGAVEVLHVSAVGTS